MKTIKVLICALLIAGGATDSRAQVKTVQMEIAGYLCGN
jgi:hypothetical protein